ncbi:hypothetical protein MC885_004798 [Smutsia gigantea]|nr:hypothetical protein MC885_004798 [Smutsia gigantea]
MSREVPGPCPATLCPPAYSPPSSTKATASSPLPGHCALTQAWTPPGSTLRNCSSTSSSRICSLVCSSGRSQRQQSSQSWLKASWGPPTSP